MDFKLLEQKKDENNSPVFSYQVIIEGLEGGIGTGYSKKESQQMAAKLTLDRLRKKPQFIDAVFAAKANRTKMEEEPVQTVPDTEVKDDFIIVKEEEKKPEKTTAKISAETAPVAEQKKAVDGKPATDEPEDIFDLSDITAAPREMTKEEIIAAAEAAAFAE